MYTYNYYNIFIINIVLLHPQLNPASLYCMCCIANVKSILGDLTDACGEYHLVLSKDARHLPALKGLGDTHYRLAKKSLEDNFDGRAVDHVEQSLLFLVR